MVPLRPQSSSPNPAADLARTRRQFLLAREQASAHESTERYALVRAMSRGAMACDGPPAVRPRP
jgi:hypothetical protein